MQVPRENSKEKDKGMGSNPTAERIFDPAEDNPLFKKDLYSELEKIEQRGKRRKRFSIFPSDK